MDALKTFISLLVIVNPIGAIPLFISLTPNQSEREKKRTVQLASLAVTLVLLISCFLGEQVIRFFGISIAYIQPKLEEFIGRSVAAVEPNVSTLGQIGRAHV